MRVVVEGTVFEGQAVDLRGHDVSPAAVVAAIRGEGTTDECPVDVSHAVSAPAPVHERVGLLRAGMGLRVRTALAEAARSRGLSAPQDEKLATVRERLAARERPGASTRAERRALSEAATEADRLRERVAELRGRLRALRDRDVDVTELETELEATARRLSERETERVAARERLERARQRAREARDARAECLRLEDRAANLQRAARASLVARVEDEYADAVAAAPGSATPADPFDADPVTAALAVARVAALRTPVVLACDRFPDADAAASWLEAPVVRL